jgi:hypothetical protein
LKRATDKAKKEYLESLYKNVTGIQRTGRYDVMYMQTKDVGWMKIMG